MPVGIRGATRGERFGTWLDLASIDARSTPEQLAAAPVHAARAALPALSLLVAIKVRCDHTQLAWGPTGSVGFELASGVPTVTESSDLDLVMRAPRPARPRLGARLVIGADSKRGRTRNAHRRANRDAVWRILARRVSRIPAHA